MQVLLRIGKEFVVKHKDYLSAKGEKEEMEMKGTSIYPWPMVEGLSIKKIC